MNNNAIGEYMKFLQKINTQITLKQMSSRLHHNNIELSDLTSNEYDRMFQCEAEIVTCNLKVWGSDLAIAVVLSMWIVTLAMYMKTILIDGI